VTRKLNNINEEGEKQLDKDLLQDIEGTGGDDRRTEISKGHGEDSGRNQHNDYRNGKHNSKGQH